MIKIDNLKVNYGNHNVLNELCLEISSNTIHGLVGLNGSGKTTLLNTIYGLKSKVLGTIQCNDEDIKRNDIAYLETINYFYPRITGKEYLNIFKTQNPIFDIDKWNTLFDLPLNKLIDDYSTGMKKKLALMGIICLNREVLILDEPFNGIDLETVQKIKTLLLKLKTKKTIIITSHILESLLPICDSISYLNDGKIEFTKKKKNFNEIENDIFAMHQDSLDKKIQELIGQ
ncbi:MAG: ABC transporter ATP-binding protein [Bacteroidales bacterium]|nr:ABC transporter ATP-binding protein [Bacteroidales bacterium]